MEGETKEHLKTIGKLEKEIAELTGLKETHLQQISKFEQEATELKSRTEDRDQISKDRDELEKQVATLQKQIEKMKEDYAQIEEVRARLALLEARANVQDILLQKNQHYIVLTAFATKIVEGKYKVGAKDIGYSPTVGISLAAWLDNFFVELEELGLVAIERTAGKGLPKATIEVTDKGRTLFEEAKERAAL